MLLATAAAARAEIDASAPHAAGRTQFDAMTSLRVEPFSVVTAPAQGGPLSAKWAGARADMEADRRLLERCAREPSRCESSGARRLLAIVAAAKQRDGRALIGEINRAINLSIRPVSDLAQYGVADRWSGPVETLTSGAGDCEDFAIAKYFALRLAGVAEADVRLVIVRDVKVEDDHAVVAVKWDARWLILDSRRLVVLEAADLRHYVPLFTLRDESINRVTHWEAPALPASSPVSN